MQLDEVLSPGTYQVSWYASTVAQSEKEIPLERQGIFYFSVDEVSTLVSGQNAPAIPSFSSDMGLKHFAHWFSFIGLLTLLGGSWFSFVIAKETGNRVRWEKASKFLYGIGVLGFVLLIIQRRVELSEVPFVEFALLKFIWIPVVQVILLSVGLWLTREKLRLLLFGLSVCLWPFATGHSTYPRYGGYVAVSMDILHLLAVSVWMGGLL